jgi:transcriptional regulator GlxA family with amidase domain
MPNPSQPPLVLFVAFPRMGLLDLTGPQTVFWAVAKRMPARALPAYERHTVSVHGGLVETVEGVTIDTLPFSAFDGRAIDTIVVPGAPEIETLLDELGPTVAWVRQASMLARRTTSVCTGAFLLAQAGLLEGKRVATHWGMSDLLKRRFPTLDVDRDAIFVRQQAIWTSAGVTAGIDLALALVEEDCGRAIAMDVARELVVFMKRPGGQAQHSELLQAQTKDGAAFDELHAWLSDNLHDSGINVDSLAERARMSSRNFSRVYKEKTGRAPGKAVELLRVEAARRLLEHSDNHLAQIARQCGFGDEERMRVTFQRNLGVTPSDYRKRFALP